MSEHPELLAFETDFGVVPAVDDTHYQTDPRSPALRAYLRYVNHEAERAFLWSHDEISSTKILGYRDWLAQNKETMQ